jgi:hypothetical protein
MCYSRYYHSTGIWSRIIATLSAPVRQYDLVPVFSQTHSVEKITIRMPFRPELRQHHACKKRSGDAPQR